MSIQIPYITVRVHASSNSQNLKHFKDFLRPELKKKIKRPNFSSIFHSKATIRANLRNLCSVMQK